MAISQAMCTSFKAEILDEQHDLVADTIKIALYTSSASLGAGTTAYSTTNEITGSGYTAGGVALSSKTVDTSGTTAYFDSADPSWTSATFTANGALIYNEAATGDPSVCVLDFGADKGASAGDFTIVFPTADASNAIIRIA